MRQVTSILKSGSTTESSLAHESSHTTPRLTAFSPPPGFLLVLLAMEES